MAELKSVDWALAYILKSIGRLPSEIIALSDAYGRVLAEDAVSTVELPPFDNSSVDGYAVRAADLNQTPISLPVVMDIPAGVFPDQVLESGQAARIMTGAPLPEGADAVVMVEDTDSTWNPASDNALPATVTIMKSAGVGANVRRIGENIHSGQTVIRAGTVLRPQHIGVLASIGFTPVPVIRQPRVAIMTSGDEVVLPEDMPARGQIRDSNNPMLAALVRQCGGIPIVLPIARDTLDDVRAMFGEALEHHPDVLVSSAGVSVGAADYVRVVLEELGQVDFWRINLRPGKPLAYGTIQGLPFFGLPGNPVSAMVTFDVFVKPTLLKMLGRTDTPASVRAIVAEDTTSDGRRSYLRVRLENRDGRLYALSTGTQSSGALLSMVLADGLMIVPEGVTHVPAGTELEVRLLNDLNL